MAVMRSAARRARAPVAVALAEVVAVSQTPGTSRIAAVTMAAGPTWACIGMCEAIT